MSWATGTPDRENYIEKMIRHQSVVVKRGNGKEKLVMCSNWGIVKSLLLLKHQFQHPLVSQGLKIRMVWGHFNPNMAMDLGLFDNEGQGILKILLSSRVAKPRAGISWLWRTQQLSEQGHAAFPRDLGTERKEGQANLVLFG